MPDQFTIVDFENEEKTPSKITGIPLVDLTDRLECEELRARVWFLDPGDEVSRHKHAEQEELYVPLQGSSQLRIDGELVEVPTGSVVRIPPKTVRQLVNESNHQHVCLIVGAPPVENDGIRSDTE